MRLKSKIAAVVLAAGVMLPSGVADAAPRGTWSPAEDWNGMSPGTFSTMCRWLGGTPVFDGELWFCEGGSIVIVCRQSKQVTATTCRRYTRFTQHKTSPIYETNPGQVYG